MPQSEIAAGVQASQVALQHLLGRRGQRLPAQTYVDSHVSQRPEKPVEVTVEPEQFVPECAGDLIHPVAAEKTALRDGNLRFALRLESAV